MGRALTRGWTLLSKELVGVLRQPMLILALVLGPFLILLVFALGHRSQQPALKAILVMPSTITLSRDLSFWRDRFGGSVTIVAITDSEATARASLASHQNDLALIIPPDADVAVSSGRQATIRILHNQINPVDQPYTDFVVYLLSSEVNKQVITEVARQAQVDVGKARTPLANLRQDLAAIPNVPSDRLARIKADLDQLDLLTADLQSIAPGLLAAPFTSRVENISPIDPGFVGFYGPGVLALLLQHMAITFTALSLVRDRLLGMTELFKVAPTSMLEVLFGKYASYALLSLGVGAALTLLLTRYLGVPLLGSPLLYWGTLSLLVFASLGIGLTISLVSASQENAVQLTMLVLLASVFFSGFFLPVTVFQTPATQVSAALPVSHAIVALQELMLGGQLSDPQPLYVLGGMGLVFLLVSMVLLRQELRRS